MTVINKQYLLKATGRQQAQTIKIIIACIVALLGAPLIIFFTMMPVLMIPTIGLCFGCIRMIYECCKHMIKLAAQDKKRKELIELGEFVIIEDEIYDALHLPGEGYWIFGKICGQVPCDRKIYVNSRKNDRIYFIRVKPAYIEKEKIYDIDLGDYLGSFYSIGEDLRWYMEEYDPAVGEEKFEKIVEEKRNQWWGNEDVICKKCGTSFNTAKNIHCPNCEEGYVPGIRELMYEKNWYKS